MASETHVELYGSRRGKHLTAFRVGDINPEDKVKVTIVLRGRRELPGPDEFVGQTMTPEELAEEFGAKKEDADKVAKFLKERDLKVEEISLITRSMCISGTAKAMEKVFRVDDWAIYHSPTQAAHRGRQGGIHIPVELEGVVTGVFGLDQRRVAHPRSGAPVSAGPGILPRPLTPEDIERLYYFPPGDGEGQSIAIAQFGGGYLRNDVIAYCNNFGLPTPHVRVTQVDDAPYTLQDILAIPEPTPRKAALEEGCEVTMDGEIIVGLCPNASISVYFSTFDERGWVDLLNKVIAARPVPVTLSISWGSAEDDKDDTWSQNGIDAINDRLNLARLLGITTCVSSGDDGCRGDVNDGQAHVSFPSSSPYVLAVGGTMLEQSGEEVTWWDDPGYREGATGGGVSTVFGRPVWQNVHIASLNPESIDGRVVPDVSALAGRPYYDLWILNLPWPGGGTSSSAPVWAALMARINASLPPNKRQRFLTPLLYKGLTKGKTVGEASCRDITTGNNACSGLQGYQAGPGFDAVTGWGVPKGVDLLNCLKQI
jgi:kumamolisin